jgi:acyl-CoA synthetase (AMP-forming)/AMP-acid ligase II
VFAGYVNGAAHTKDADPWGAGLRVDGQWLRTGDRGIRNADGTVTFRGVIKPMFTRNGFNIYPREIEHAVTELPGVRRTRVSAIPDAIRENDIAIEVDGDRTADDVKRWCDERLSVYKRPSSITIHDGIA